MATFNQFIASLEQDFGEQGKGKPFEVFCKWFLENDPEWSKTVDKVWLWDDYPNKWQRQDLGTDLVFRDNDGLIWAVQAKCYGEHRTTTKGDMNSFLADTGRREVDRRLWLQSTNKIEAKAEKTLKGQDKPVTVFMLNDFRDAQLEYPSSFADLHQAKVKDKPTPDPHQSKAIADATSGLKTSDRGQMIMACGTGKTFTTLWIKEALEAHNTLVLLPSLSLLSQTMREWAWAGNTDFDILNVCSDKSVGKKTEDMNPSDAPFPVTSEVEEIAKFLKRPKPKVIFCTYQSSELIAQAQLDGSVPTFDLVVADEAHRCAGKADAGFATILDGEKIRATKRLFTTATPRYFGKAIKDAAKANDLAVVGMDNEAVFGPVIHKLTFGQAIYYEPEPLLNDYQVVIVGVDEPMVREWIENYEIVSTDPDSQTDARTLAAKIGMLKAVKDYDLKRVISFHSRVAGAKQFSDELVDVANLIEPANRPEGTFLSDYVSGAMKAGDRKEKIDRLKVLEGYDRGILTNARCLAEGVDVPSLDGVAFVDPRGSQVEIIQAVGRAIRKVRGAKVQKKGTIVLPVFIEDGDDHEASIEASNFKPVWDVLKALRAHDEVLADTLDGYRTNMAKNASQSRESISDNIIFDMPVSVDAQFSSALRTVLVEASTASWEFWFGLLEQFNGVEGHCRVPGEFNVDGYSLGKWVARQRTSLKNNMLSQKQIAKLDRLSFIWDSYDDMFELGICQFTKNLLNGGMLNYPKEYVDKDGFHLGMWIHMRRSDFNTGRLNEQRKAKLDELGFIWNVNDHKFQTAFFSLQKFFNDKGHSSVPVKYVDENGFNLGGWTSHLKKKLKSLDQEKLRLLASVNFNDNPVFEENFDYIIQLLQQYYKEHGHSDVPVNHVCRDGTKLGQWCATRRTNYSRGINTFNKAQIMLLESINFNLKSRFEKRWDEGITELKNYYEYHKTMEIAATYKSKSGFKLGNWVASRRSELKSGFLSKERQRELDELGFIWDPIETHWEEGFSKLIQFTELEGHCRVPRGLKLDGYSLGTWVNSQRIRYKSNGLSPEKQQRLNDIGFIWDASKDKT